MALLLWATPLMAETYSWVDENGTTNFTEDYSRIPKKYRTQVNRLGDICPLPSSASRDIAAAGQTGQGKAAGSVAPTDAGKDSYGGRKAEVWQQEFRSRGAELKGLEKRLVELEALMKKPEGISRDRLFGLPQEFKDTQRKYNEALKRYNDLNDTANKAGVPAECRM
jgi:hypothetical protein